MSGSSNITPREFAQTIKDRLRIESVVAEYVPSLKQAGHSLKGLCPFHNEKTPSFHVHPDQDFYYCFGCQASGDLIKFVEEIEKVDFMIALEMLAKRAGLEMPDFRQGGTRSEHEEQRLKTLRELCAWAEEFFMDQLSVHPRGALAREYLHGRGLSDDEIRHYRLGYSPAGFDELLKAAGRRGWKEETLAEAGLASRRERGGFIDRFRDRVMFPITDRMGQTVAFGGRLIEKRDDAPKYINSAETPIFKKGSQLYGTAMAREAIKQEGFVVMLEGYMDWIALHRSGVCNVLAGLGTAMGEDQARLVKRLTGRAILMYDGDAAGQKAMYRTTELLLRQGVAVQAAVLPPEHDPDSFIQSEGTQALRGVLSAAPSALDYFLDLASRQFDLHRPEAKAEAVGYLAPLLLAISEPALREGYMERTADRLGLRLEALDRALRRREKSSGPRTAYPAAGERYAHGGGGPVPYHDEPGLLGSPEDEQRRRTSRRTEQNLIFILLQGRANWELLAGIEPDWFQDPVMRAVFERLRDIQRDVREGADPPASMFDMFEAEEEQQLLRQILMTPSMQFGGEVEGFEHHLLEGLQFQLLKLKRQWNQRRMRELSQDLRVIAGPDALGQDQLRQIEHLSRQNLLSHQDFLDKFGKQ